MLTRTCLTTMMILLTATAARRCCGFSSTLSLYLPASSFYRNQVATSTPTTTMLQMGWFDGIAQAFGNEEFQGIDQRVQASHILIKIKEDEPFDTAMDKVKILLQDINERMTTSTAEDNKSHSHRHSKLLEIFAAVAQQASECPSATQGGDLGLFGPGKMVPEFDAVLFPSGDNNDASSPPPPAVGSILGPIVTDFGLHLILVTKRETSRNQVEEKLARIDKDAM